MMLEMRADTHMDFHEKLTKFLSVFNKKKIDLFSNTVTI
jgi:hypothetical protein